MPLDPHIVARYWLINWSKSTSEHEKTLNSWVSDVLWAAMQNDADYAFQIIEAIHEQDKEQEHIEVFAAGPIEELLVHHGETVIQRVVAKASEDPKFASVLGGVWKNSISDTVWDLVLKYRSTESWADPREA